MRYDIAKYIITGHSEIQYNTVSYVKIWHNIKEYIEIYHNIIYCNRM